MFKKISVRSLIEYEEEEEQEEEKRLLSAAEVMWLHVGSAVCQRRCRSRGDQELREKGGSSEVKPARRTREKPRETT